MINIMVTQEWAWIQQQLDFPRYKWIKIHAMRNDTHSYCGLENHTDEGETTLEEFIDNRDACKRCVKSCVILSS